MVNTKPVCSNRLWVGLDEVEELQLALLQAIQIYEAFPPNATNMVRNMWLISK